MARTNPICVPQCCVANPAVLPATLVPGTLPDEGPQAKTGRAESRTMPTADLEEAAVVRCAAQLEEALLPSSCPCGPCKALRLIFTSYGLHKTML